jgi:hypothetical protein
VRGSNDQPRFFELVSLCVQKRFELDGFEFVFSVLYHVYIAVLGLDHFQNLDQLGNVHLIGADLVFWDFVAFRRTYRGTLESPFSQESSWRGISARKICPTLI